MVELALNRGQVVKDVGVVKLEVVQNRGARPVVHKLAAFVKKRGVVFIGLNHKGISAAESGRHAKIQRHTAHQKTRLQASALQNPGQHGGGGGFAVGAGYRQHMARTGGVVGRVMQHMARQPLRAAGVGQTGVQYCLHQGISGFSAGIVYARNHVAHHKHVGIKSQLIRPITLDQLYPQPAQLIAHGRINASVATRDLVSRLACQRRQPAHESAANPQNMYVHAGILGGKQEPPLAPSIDESNRPLALAHKAQAAILFIASYRGAGQSQAGPIDALQLYAGDAGQNGQNK